MIYRILLLCLSIIFLAGCWDNVEIQERGYILGIAIDQAPKLPKGFEKEEEYKSERDIEKVPLQQKKTKYIYTIQVPNVALAKIRPTGAGGGSGGEPGSTTWDLTLMGNSFMEVNRILHTRLDFPAFYEHLQTIVISEAVAKEGISKVLDLFLRDHEMRRRTKIFISSGEAKKILDITPRITDYPAIYLADLPDNSERTARILHLTDLGQVSQSLHTKVDFVLPKVVATKDELRVAGGAVFKGEKMVGWLGEIDTIFTKFVRDAVKSQVLVIEDPKHAQGLIVLEVSDSKTKVRPQVDDDKIKMKIDIELESNLAEKHESHYTNALDDEYLKSLGKAAEKYLEKEIVDTIKYVQKEFGADIFHFNVQMKRYEPQIWEQVKSNWDNIFPQLEVDVEVKTKVRQIGTMT